MQMVLYASKANEQRLESQPNIGNEAEVLA
jgi:hypothetical protein